jgi:hypothetical protein
MLNALSRALEVANERYAVCSSLHRRGLQELWSERDKTSRLIQKLQLISQCKDITGQPFVSGQAIAHVLEEYSE